MRASSLHDLRETETRELLGSSSTATTTETSSQRWNRIGGPRRRVACGPQNDSNIKTQHWRQDSDASDHSRSSLAGGGVKRRNSSPSNNSSSSPSLFGLVHATTSSSTGYSDAQQPLPSLGVISSELLIVCSLYIKHAARSLRRPYQRFRKIFCYGLCSLLAIILLLIASCAIGFYRDATRVCTPPPGYEYQDGRPLVEYYIHGRGIGHYARSVAIVEELNKAGVDIRMFLSRAAMWRALHEDSKLMINEVQSQERGTTTAISVASLTPSMDFFTTLSHLVERIVGDCEVAASTKRYPLLVITDGDMPGMLRAKFGGIPSVGISHGQLFSIAHKPSWVANNGQLSRSWNKEGRLNAAASYFSEWQIATHFCFLESNVASGVVARAPLRPEVLQMAVARKRASQGEFMPDIPQVAQVKSLLLQDDMMGSESGIDKNRGSVGNDVVATVHPTKRRKLVMCYFRDRNGGMVTDALLHAGFDVLVFDSGYTKDAQSDPHRYGVQWIVDDRAKHRQSLNMRTYEDAMQQPNAAGGFESTLDRAHSRGRRRLLEVGEKEDAYDSRNNSDEDLPPARLIRVSDRSLFVPLMHIADGVASSAGSQLMSECIHAGMPLLALYLENDDEQKLNVELSRRSVSCPRKPQVFGSSFENFNVETNNLRGWNSNNSTMAGGSHRDRSSNTGHSRQHWGGLGGGGNSHAWKELEKFVDVVRESDVSSTFYRYYHGGLNGNTNNIPKVGGTTTNDNVIVDEAAGVGGGQQQQQQQNQEEDNEPFHGLPDAAAIILEIIKEVEMGGR